MKAPDKLVFNEALFSDIGIFGIEDKTEYIRKNALLEWAKEAYLNKNANAIRKVCYKQLIDKLNSM